MAKLNIKYINIPSDLLFEKNIPALAKILYGQIKVLSYKDGICRVTNKVLADNNHCSTKTISRMIKILDDYKYIRIVDKRCYRKIMIN